MAATIDMCLATYQGARFLGAQLDSIKAQSFTDWHLYSRDDSSSNGTREVITDVLFEHLDKVTVLEEPAR